MECAILRQSWIWTSTPNVRVVLRMDDDTDELLALLCTRIGMIMEDACVVALKTGQAEFDQRVAAVWQIEQTAEKIAALARAAKALLD